MKKIFLILIFSVLFSCSNNKNNDSINTATVVDIDSLNPYNFVSSSTNEIMLNVYEGLVKPSEKDDIEPAIAKSYDISKDGLTYTFEIRDDVYFHNGTKLEMNDVVFSINKMKELALQSAFNNIEEVKTNGNKLIIKLKEVDSSLIYYLTTAIVDEETFNDLEKKANGTGPYYISNYQRQQRIELAKFDKYYGEKANISKINIDILPKFETSFLKLISGEYNFLSGLNSKRLNEIKDKKIISYPRNMMFIFALNNKKYTKEVREAINSVIDKDNIIKQVTNSYAKKIGINSVNSNTDILKDLVINLKVPVNDTIYTDTAQVIKQQLSKYDVKVNIQAIEWSTWLKEVYTDKNYDATIIGFVGKLDKDATYRRYTTSYKKNFINFSNEEYDNLILKAKKTNDKAERDALYSKAENILYSNYASIFIMDPEIIVAMDNNITNYVSYKIPFINFAKLKFEDKK